MDVLVAATFGIPAAAGLAGGWYGWRAGAATAAVIGVTICAGVFVYGVLPATDCPDCTQYAAFLPLAWVFVLMISGGWIWALASAGVGFWAGRWVRGG